MSEKLKNTQRDWSKFDAHVITQEEYDEIPELTDEFFDKATFHIGGQTVSKAEFAEAAQKQTQRGRPKSDNNKVLLSVRYSPEVVEYFRSTGEGWQTRMDEALKEWVKDHAA